MGEEEALKHAVLEVAGSSSSAIIPVVAPPPAIPVDAGKRRRIGHPTALRSTVVDEDRGLIPEGVEDQQAFLDDVGDEPEPVIPTNAPVSEPEVVEEEDENAGFPGTLVQDAAAAASHGA
ncbi:unnamed protein product, partial [Amoebophrya sp. A25]|eukprot:GSA25T00027065001.1